MRQKRNFSSIVKTIKRYSEDTPIISTLSALNKNSGKFESTRTEKVRKIAIFKKNGGYVYGRAGAEKKADIKIYAYDELYADDETNRKADVLVKDGETYKVVSVEKRTECKPVVFIAFGVYYDH